MLATGGGEVISKKFSGHTKHFSGHITFFPENDKNFSGNTKIQKQIQS